GTGVPSSVKNRAATSPVARAKAGSSVGEPAAAMCGSFGQFPIPTSATLAVAHTSSVSLMVGSRCSDRLREGEANEGAYKNLGVPSIPAASVRTISLGWNHGLSSDRCSDARYDACTIALNECAL